MLIGPFYELQYHFLSKAGNQVCVLGNKGLENNINNPHAKVPSFDSTSDTVKQICFTVSLLLRFNMDIRHIKITSAEGLYRINDKKAFKGLIVSPTLSPRPKHYVTAAERNQSNRNRVSLTSPPHL